MESPRLPPLVFKLNSHKPERICHRKNALAHARFPAPIFCPKDNMEQAREGHLADLTYVELQEDGRAKPAVAYMLENGIATWNDFARGPGVRDPGPAADGGGLAGGRGALREAVGARNIDLIYTMHTSRRLRLPAPAVVLTQLLSNRSCRPVHDFVMASEYVAVSRIRDALAARYLKAVKTDCVVSQDLPKKFQGLVDGLVRERHPDGTPVYRCEEVKGLEGQYRIPRIEAKFPFSTVNWKVAEDPVLHCLEGGGLLLTEYPGTGKTYLARQIVTTLREEGYKVKIITKTTPPCRTSAETADHWPRSTVRNGTATSTGWRRRRSRSSHGVVERHRLRSLLCPCFKTALRYGVISGCFVRGVSPSPSVSAGTRSKTRPGRPRAGF